MGEYSTNGNGFVSHLQMTQFAINHRLTRNYQLTGYIPICLNNGPRQWSWQPLEWFLSKEFSCAAKVPFQPHLVNLHLLKITFWILKCNQKCSSAPPGSEPSQSGIPWDRQTDRQCAKKVQDGNSRSCSRGKCFNPKIYFPNNSLAGRMKTFHSWSHSQTF